MTIAEHLELMLYTVFISATVIATILTLVIRYRSYKEFNRKYHYKTKLPKK